MYAYHIRLKLSCQIKSIIAYTSHYFCIQIVLDYLYFHIYQYADFLSHLHTQVILQNKNQVSLCISLLQFHSFIKLPSFVIWIIIFVQGCQFPNFFNIWSSHNQLFQACLQLSLWVHHSRFSTLLSVLSQFLWFISCFHSIGLRKIVPTILWTRKDSLFNQYTIYHFDCMLHFQIRSLFFTLHKLLTWYFQSYQGISFQISLSIKY